MNYSNNHFYESVARENQESMMKSYFSIHNFNSKIPYEEEILQKINYNNLNSMQNGLTLLQNYAHNLDNQYINKDQDPEDVEECIKIWKLYYQLQDKIEKFHKKK